MKNQPRLVEMTDEQIRRVRDYGSSPKERRAARQELSERSAMAALRDEVVRALAESGEDPDTKIRARREWQRRQAEARRRAVQEQEADHAAG